MDGIQRLVPAFDGGDNFGGVGGPKRVWAAGCAQGGSS